MGKAVRQASSGPSGTKGVEVWRQICGSLFGEQNRMARTEKLENHNHHGKPRIQLTSSSNARQEPGLGLPGEGECILEVTDGNGT